MIDIDFKFYRAILWQRLPLILAIWVLLAGAGVAVAYLLPPVYRSAARILVVKPQIDPALALQTVNLSSSEIIQNIEQRLKTRTNMLEIAERYDIFANQPDLTPSERVNKMLRSTDFFVLNLGANQAGPSATAFVVAFSSASPELANDIANEYVTNILGQNQKIRTGIAEDTASFFEQEAAQLANELTDLEGQIVTFENNNADALPNSLDFRRGEMSRIQVRLAQIDTQELALLDQKAQIERVISDPSLRPAVPVAQQTPEERQLTALNAQLAQLRAVYSDTNHQVVQVMAQIKGLEEIIRGDAGSDPAANMQPIPSQMQLNLDQINTNLDFLESQRKDLEVELDRLKETIEETPNVGMQLNVLNRQYAALQQRYDAAQAQLNIASTGESIEVRQQGERFEVIEQPTIPEEPTSPNRLLIAAMGIIGGLGAGLGLAVLLELLNKSVRRPSELVNALGIQPFATVPYIATQGEIMRRRLKGVAVLLVAVAGIPLLLYVIHYQYMPIDLILSRVAERFGFGGLASSLS